MVDKLTCIRELTMSAIVLRSSSCESPINAKVLSDAFNMYSLPSLPATTVNEQISMPPNNSETFKKIEYE